MKTIFPSYLQPMQLQMLMQTAVSPRPIALASTIDKNGVPNVSPFSFFNMFSVNPPILVFSPLLKPQGNPVKDTLKNIQETLEVVIGNVSYKIAQQISIASADYDSETDEFVKSGLTKKSADLVKPFLIEESPVNFECKVLEIKSLGEKGGAGNLIICEVLKIHINEDYLNEQGILDQKKLELVSRLGALWYGKTSAETLFEIPRPISGKVIGLDHLPNEIKNSKILTGNDLGALSNIETLPEGKFSEDENVHQEAQKLLQENKIEEAWKILIN